MSFWGRLLGWWSPTHGQVWWHVLLRAGESGPSERRSWLEEQEQEGELFSETGPFSAFSAFSETGPFSAFSAFNDRREKRKQNLAQSWREGLEP